MKPHTLKMAVSIFLATTLGGAHAIAQESSSTTARLMEEIVVSARGIEEGLQDAPIAVSAFTGETLDYRGVDSLDQIERFVPSLTLHNNPSFGGASNSAAIYLRGVGQKEFLPTTEPGVGLYVDGVYVARSVGAILDIVDIERLVDSADRRAPYLVVTPSVAPSRLQPANPKSVVNLRAVSRRRVAPTVWCTCGVRCRYR